MRIRAAAVVFAIASAWGSVSFAQTNVVQEPDKTVYRGVTVLEFGLDQVSGRDLRPDETYIVSRNKAKFASLMKVRANFQPEMERSVDDL